MKNFHTKVPEEQYQRLIAFRASHLTKSLDVANKTWPYITCGQGEKTLFFLAGAFLPADITFTLYPEAYTAALKGFFEKWST